MKRGMRKTAAACCIALLLLSGCGKTAGNVNSDTADSSAVTEQSDSEESAASQSDTDDIEKQVEEFLGVTEDKYSKVQIGVNITTDETGGNLDYYAQTAYMTQVQAGTLDVMLMPEQLYDSLNTDGIFLNLEELLGDHAFGEFGTQSDQTHITIKDSRLAEEFGLSYDTITIVVPASAPDQKNAAKWLESLISEE